MFASFLASVLVWVFSGPRAWSLFWSCVRSPDSCGRLGTLGYYGDIVLLSGWPPVWVQRAVVWLSRWFPVRPVSSDIPF
jgi:hypothetical protein